MITRKPLMLDVVKIATIMCPKNVDERGEFVALWLKNQQDDSFIDLVVVHKKKILGFIAGNLTDTHFSITWMKAESKDVLSQLWTKITKTYEFDTAGIAVADPSLFQELGFSTLFTVMQYNKHKGSDSQ